MGLLIAWAGPLENPDYLGSKISRGPKIDSSVGLSKGLTQNSFSWPDMEICRLVGHFFLEDEEKERIPREWALMAAVYTTET